jgi:hypothetical protein
MKMLLGLMMILALCVTTSASASPFLVCDPSPQAVGLDYEVMEAGKVVFSGANQPDGSIKVDFVDIPTGDHTYTARYVKIDLLWGNSYFEPSTPLSFTRPVVTSPGKPLNPKLSK